MNTGQWPALAAEERMDITARVAAMSATVEAERKAMESRMQKLEDALGRGVSRALQLLVGIALAVVGGVIAIHVQLTRTEERQNAGEQRYAEMQAVLERRLDDLSRRLDRLELQAPWPRGEGSEPAPLQRRGTRGGRP